MTRTAVITGTRWSHRGPLLGQALLADLLGAMATIDATVALFQRQGRGQIVAIQDGNQTQPPLT